MTVQFNHRLIAYLIFAVAAIHLYTLWRENKIQPSAILLAIVIFVQIILGIFSLLYVVPINLALAHQGGAVITLAIAIWHYHRLIRYPR